MKALLSFAMIALLGACVSPTLEPSDDSRDLDGELIAEDYHFDFQRQCFCLQEAVQPVTIYVSDGLVENVVVRDSGARMAMAQIEWPTMQQILAEVDDAEARGDLTEIRYSDQHLPVYVEIGSLAADAGYIYEIGRVIQDN